MAVRWAAIIVKVKSENGKVKSMVRFAQGLITAPDAKGQKRVKRGLKGQKRA